MHHSLHCASHVNFLEFSYTTLQISEVPVLFSSERLSFLESRKQKVSSLRVYHNCASKYMMATRIQQTAKGRSATEDEMGEGENDGISGGLVTVALLLGDRA